MSNSKIVTVNISEQKASSYPIFIGEGIINDAEFYFKNYLRARKILVVTNKKVAKLYLDKLLNSLSGYEVSVIELEDGEKYKSLTSLEQIWNKACGEKLERKDAMIALGGGVIGDITGFAAATYLRGVDFVQIPTTLLAQVDSSVGGKVAINNEFGKNLIGNFYQPKLVLADISILKTLDDRQLKTGLAEVVKYAFIEKTCSLPENNDFISYLERKTENMQQIVEYCCKLKAAVVNQDEKECGLRAILNLGHTIGHAIERVCGYGEYTHGEAVAIGLKGVFYLSKQLNLIDEAYFNRALTLLSDYDLDYKLTVDMDLEQLYGAMAYDKKVIDAKVRFILPVAVGEVKIFDNIEKDVILKCLNYLQY